MCILLLLWLRAQLYPQALISFTLQKTCFYCFWAEMPMFASCSLSISCIGLTAYNWFYRLLLIKNYIMHFLMLHPYLFPHDLSCQRQNVLEFSFNFTAKFFPILSLIPAALIPWVAGSWKSHVIWLTRQFCKFSVKKEYMAEFCHVVLIKLEVK